MEKQPLSVLSKVLLDLRICVKDAPIAPLLVLPDPSIFSVILTLHCAPSHNPLLKKLLKILLWPYFNGCLKPGLGQLRVNSIVELSYQHNASNISNNKVDNIGTMTVNINSS